ncbi:unnamed protein product [Lupinus luteus]|uniref:DCD domain-containing protein n=1 Tax=Lupinus luteus TaxID=3873 RepID=A0AAV1XT03_LUPLU
MGVARKQQTFHYNETLPLRPYPVASSLVGRNLGKYQLGGVIFGCKNSTIQECLSKQLFGLPAQHFWYVKDIDRGLPLFLFNYSDRKLHGIFEAAGKGQMYIDPYAWTTDCTEITKYPAQVQMRVRLQCQTLPEDKFAQVIIDNYFSRNHFWFELDHKQTSKLISLLVSAAFAPGNSIPRYPMKRKNVSENFPSHGTLKRTEAFGMPESSEGKTFTQSWRREYSNAMTFLECDTQPMKTLTVVKEENRNEKTLIYEKLKEFALTRESEDHSLSGIANGSPDHNNMCSVEKVDSSGTPFQDQYTKLMQEVQELMAFKKIQTQKNCYLEQKLMDATFEIQLLKDRCTILESECNLPLALDKKIVTESFSELQLDQKEALFLIGGSDGESQLESMDLYCPSKNVIKSRAPSAACSYSLAVQLNDELYAFGGGNGHILYDKVESYNPIREKWTLFSSLSLKKESLAVVSLNNKIFVVGHGKGTVCFSDVEILDLDNGRWISTRLMMEKRFALAAMELDGALYASGGYNGIDYFKSAEIFDPREYSWTIKSNMNTKRECYPMIDLNEKLYALVRFDGSTMVTSIKVFDSRLKAWVMEEQINHLKVYFAAATFKEEIQRVRTLRIHSSK